MSKVARTVTISDGGPGRPAMGRAADSNRSRSVRRVTSKRRVAPKMLSPRAQLGYAIDGPKSFRFRVPYQLKISDFSVAVSPDTSIYKNVFMAPFNSNSISYVADLAFMQNLYKDFRVKRWSITAHRNRLTLGGQPISGNLETSMITIPMMTTVAHTDLVNTANPGQGQADSLPLVPTAITRLPTGWKAQLEQTGRTKAHGGEQSFTRYWKPESPFENRYMPFGTADTRNPYGAVQIRMERNSFVNQQGEVTALAADQVLLDGTIDMIIECKTRL